MSAKRDYYEVLGVAKDAGQKEIKDAFRTLAMKYHPDRNKQPDAEARFKEIAEAYAILSDPKKRADYDAQGFEGLGDVNQQDIFSGINFDDIFGGFDFGLGFGNPFESFFRHHRTGPVQGANIEAELYVSLERVANGGEETITLRRPGRCPACQGTGTRGGVPPRTCPACGGSGHITHSRREKGSNVLIQQVSICPDCNGSGQLIDQPCPECHGSGEVSREETLEIRIPRGIEEGMGLRIHGKGMPSPQRGGAAGDLLVIVRTRHDPRFVRDGENLLRLETISVVDAVLGTKLEVPTLDGSATVTIPPGTQPGSVLRLKDKGLPKFDSRQRGVMLLQIAVKIPEHLSREARELYERLRESGG